MVYTKNDGALAWAAKNGHLDVVKYLVEEGANIHTRNVTLRWTFMEGSPAVLKYLAEQGTDIHVGMM